MRKIYTEIEISASPERVWEVLTDFPDYIIWNPFIRQIEGPLKVGERLVVRIHPPGSRARTLKPLILYIEPNRELRWRGVLIYPGMFDGEHAFIIQPIGVNRVRFIQTEAFTGLLAPFMTGRTEIKVKLGFDAMNHALKTQAEHEQII